MIFSIEPLNDFLIKKIETLTEEVVQIIDQSKDYSPLLSQIEILICRDRHLTPEFINSCKNLKLIYIVSAGIEKLPFSVFENRNIKIANVGDISANAMSHYAIGAILMFSCNFYSSLLNQKNHYWQKFVTNNGISGQKLLILGTGKIGTAIAKKASAFGMYVEGVNSSQRAVPYFSEIHSIENCDAVLSEADFVVCTLPSTDHTRGMINKHFFQKMKPSSIFINISRGAIVNEKDLISSLETEKIAGAVLDVFAQEPLPVDSPLWNAKNLIITPHCSGRLENFMNYAIDVFIENYHLYTKTGNLKTEVNIHNGY